MRKNTKKMFSGLAGAAMLVSGCAAAGQPVGEKTPQTVQVQPQDVKTAAQSPEQDGLVMTQTQNEGISYTKVANVSGQFRFDQDVISPADDVFNIFGTALTGVCAKPAFAVGDAATECDPADYYVNVHGSMRQSYSVRLGELQDKEQTRVMACACATGEVVVNASVTGVPLSDILELAQLEAGANTLTAVGADGFGIPMPLSFALEKEAMLVYRVNGQPLPENQRTQLWMPGTVAKYFTRNIVDIEVTAQEEAPEILTADDEHRAQVAIMNYLEGDALPAGREITFEGYADDYDKAVTAIQVSMDDGETWSTYEAEGATADKWVYWYFTYTPETSGTYKITVRAVTEDGSVSPLASSLVFRVSDSAVY